MSSGGWQHRWRCPTGPCNSEVVGLLRGRRSRPCWRTCSCTCATNATGRLECRSAFVKQCCVGDEGFVALRRRPAEGDVKPPRAALAEDRCGERLRKRRRESRQAGIRKASVSEPLLKHRKTRDGIKTGVCV